jgi:class 3 adenylate cyclase
MDPEFRRATLVFSDVCGSTKLFEAYGDVRARSIVGEALRHIMSQTEKHHGSVVSIAGDGVLSVFEDAASAMAMANATRGAVGLEPTLKQYGVALRIGLHTGQVLQDANGVYGDAVNLAARVNGLAKAEQIITTGATYAELPASVRELMRPLRRMKLRGKHEEVELFEVISSGSPDKLTIVPKSFDHRAHRARLILTYRDAAFDLGPYSAALLMGRGEQCALVIDRACVSRRHASIDPQNGKFLLSDFSTNGTFIYGQDGHVEQLHREETYLRGEGQLSLGEDRVTDNPDLIHFSVTY